jgi:Tfp pilus assembly protein FimT
MLITVTLVALAASIAIPSAAPVSSFAAEAVAGEVTRALRFAQREAIRTGTWRYVCIAPVANSLIVYDALSACPGTNSPVSHPIDKSDYRIDFDSAAGARAQLANSEFRYEDSTTRNYVGFNPDGEPAVRNGWQTTLLRSTGKVVVRHGHVEREIAVHPVTGRVTP